jgi:hypothetical protein
MENLINSRSKAFPNKTAPALFLWRGGCFIHFSAHLLTLLLIGGRCSLGWLFQRLFDILYPMVARVTVKIERPFRLAFPTAEPFFGCLL